MAIPKSVIDSIHQHIDIVDVIGDFVRLKKKGANYWACCPFHGEKTPSFAVNPAKNIFKCFGCGKSGDAITFVMEHEKLSYPDTLRYLAKKYGIQYTEENVAPSDAHQQHLRDSLYIVLNYAKNFYCECLHHSEEGQSIGMSYFKERGFSLEVIKKFELGYSLNEWDALLKNALAANYNIEILEKAGLVQSRDNANDKAARKYYDRFRGRVMFPIHSVTGKVLAFGARILNNDKSQPKYINSPETEIYHKSDIVYGIYQAKNDIRTKNNCYLVEGYTDVISMHQAGVQNVVASSGTSLTVEQIRLIKRYCENITVLYDGDTAGIKAAMRGIDMILEEGMNVSVVLFTDGEDPDSFVRKHGAAAFIQYLENNTKDFITFKTSVYLTDAGNNPLKKAPVIREIVTTISKIPDAIKRSLFFKTCSQLLDIDEQVLITEYNKIVLQKRKDTHKNNLKEASAGEHAQQEKDDDLPASLSDITTTEKDIHEKALLKILMLYGSEKIDENLSVCHYIISETEDIESHSELFLRIINEVKKQWHEGNEIHKNFFLHHPDPEISAFAKDAFFERYSLSEHWIKYGISVASEIDMLSQNVPKYILRYKRLIVRMMMEKARKQFSDKNIPDEQLQELLMHYKQLQGLYTEINRLLGIVVG